MKKNSHFLEFVNEFKAELLEMEQDEFDLLLSKSDDGYSDILGQSFLFEDSSDSIATIYGGQGSIFYDLDVSVRFDVQTSPVFSGSFITTFESGSSIAFADAFTYVLSGLSQSLPMSPTAGAIVISAMSAHCETKVVSKKANDDEYAGSGYSWAA